MPVTKIKISKEVIFRVPLFPLNASLQESWEALKEAISDSSPDFFQQVKNIASHDIETLPEKVLHTIHKYFNRAKYRPVPYGTFTGIGLISPLAGEKEKTVKVSSAMQPNVFADWSQKDNMTVSIRDIIAGNEKLFTNSTYYQLDNQIRYVARNENEFELCELSVTAIILDILQVCRSPVPYHTLQTYLQQKDWTSTQVQQQVKELLERQLLLSSLSPNIIGQDFFSRVGISAAEGGPHYMVSGRSYLGGRIAPHLLARLPKAVRALQHLLPPPVLPASLAAFITRFQARFDRQELPLMLALDPEGGIGYGSLEQEATLSDLIANLAGKVVDSNDTVRFKTLMSGGLELKPGQVIQLDKLHMDSEATPPLLPNTFTAVATVADDLLCVSYIGGCTANSMAGRFTFADDNILQHCRTNASTEQDANPDVLFFDIAYTAESAVDNVNRRRAIYDMQLSILDYDTTAQPLTLDDIRVSVLDGEVILRSEKYHKRLIPRLASAYNYTRSDLAVFRFFCDLQHQGLQTNLTPDLQQLLPGLHFYPRIQYANIVLSPAKWRLPRKGLPANIQTDEQLSHYLESIGAPRYCKVGPADQKLCLDLESPIDRRLLYAEWRRFDETYLEEALLPTQSMVTDEKGDVYYCQFLLTLFHSGNLYTPAIAPLFAGSTVPRMLTLGGEWLYVEIYCHPLRADSILTHNIREFLFACGPEIKAWFFIRYDEGGPHIRLRLQQTQQPSGLFLLTALIGFLKPELDSGLIADIQLKTYRRELERYHPDEIEAIEEHFCVDSEYVLQVLDHNETDEHKYSRCLELAFAIQEQVFKISELLEISRNVFQALATEHQLSEPGYKQLGTVQKDIMARGSDDPFVNSLVQSFVQQLQHCAPSRKRQLFVDLFHMHVNRLFPANQRTYELVVYYLLSRRCLTIMTTMLNTPKAGI